MPWDWKRLIWRNYPIVPTECIVDATTAGLAWIIERQARVEVRCGKIPGAAKGLKHAQAFGFYKGKMKPLIVNRQGDVEPSEMPAKFDQDRVFSWPAWLAQIRRWTV